MTIPRNPRRRPRRWRARMLSLGWTRDDVRFCAGLPRYLYRLGVERVVAERRGRHAILDRVAGPP